MKLAILQHIIGTGGGNDRVLFSLLEALKKTDIDFTIFTISKPLVDMSEYKLVTLLPFKLKFLGIYQKLLQAKSIFRNLRGYDLVLCLTDIIVPEESPPVIFYDQNIFADSIKSTKYEKGYWRIYYKLYLILRNRIEKKIKKSNMIFVANSNYTKSKLKKMGINAEVIYPPVRMRKFNPNATKEKKTVTIARYSEEKKLEVGIDAFKKLDSPHMPYIIFGSTTNQLNKNYYKKLVRLAENRNNITLLRNQSQEMLQEILAYSKVYLQTSMETFGIAVVEAIASGCIPIVPDNTANRETVPFKELRYYYKSGNNACLKIAQALNGDFDNYIPKLQENALKNFNENVFQSKIINLIYKHGIKN